MTTQVKVPVMDVLELATWLSVNANDLKAYIDNAVAAGSVPSVSGHNGEVLTNNGTISLWEEIKNLLPTLIASSYLFTDGTDLSWEQPKEVPDISGVPDGHVVTKSGTGYVWAPQTLTGNPVFEVIDEQVYTSTVRGTTLWAKPIAALPDDLVVIRGWGGGGSGGTAAGYFRVARYASGGFGGRYLETVCKASDLAATMVPVVGAGGKASTVIQIGGSGSSVVNGKSGERTMFAERDGGASRDVTLTMATQCVVTDAGHPYSSGDTVVLHELDPTLLSVSNRAFTVEVIGAGSYYLLDTSAGGARLNTSTFTPSTTAGKICKIVTPVLDVYGGEGGKGYTKGAVPQPNLTAEELLQFVESSSSYKGQINGFEVDADDFYFRGGSSPASEAAFSAGAVPHKINPAAGGAGACSKHINVGLIGTGANGKSKFGGDGGTLTGTANPLNIGPAQEPGGGGASHAGQTTDANGWSSGPGAYGRLIVTVIRTSFPMRGRWDYNWQLPDGGIGGSGVL